ncbi:MAG: NAD(P)H-binding protein [Thermodesulfovibrionales bacterium]
MLFIAGSTGFIGKNLLEALREKGLKARCLVRSGEKARAVEEMGFEAALGDITDAESLKGALDGVKTAVHLVGIIAERGGQTFEKVHVEGTRNLVAEAKSAGVGRFFYQSALGADLGSWAKYHRTKAEAEEIVKASGIPWTIFRPSLVVGEGDGFTTRIQEMIRLAPVIPVPGDGKARFQPIYVGDWVKCFLKAMDDPGAEGRTYELGGPEHITYNEIVKAVSAAMGRSKALFHFPAGLALVGLKFLEKTPFSPATVEQLKLLDTDNICQPDAVRKDFGFEPMAFRDALKLFI